MIRRPASGKDGAPVSAERPQRGSAHARRRALPWAWFLNLALATLVGLGYLGRIAEEAPARVLLFAVLGLVSSLATLGLVPLAVLWACARSRGFLWLQAVVWMLFQLGLFIDTRIYRLFGYHFNGSALNLLVTRGSEDSYRLGSSIWITGCLLAGCLVALELGAWHLCLSRALRAGASAPGPRRRALSLALLLLAVVGVEKTLYAHAEVTLDRQLTTASQVLPLYPRLSVRPFLPESMRAALPEVPPVRLFEEPRPLAYPRVHPAVDPCGPRPDICVLVIDSWRADMLDEQVTPHLSELARSSRRFADHLSGGNGTRFGLFSLLYGLHGSYWWSVLEARRSPVLLDVLQELGYEVRVYSSASMDFPELRPTAWSRLPEAVFDEFGSERRSVRDELLAEDCRAWWRARAAAAPGERRPAFTFVLLDSAHQTYDFPEAQAPFRPYARALDYLELARSQEPELVEAVRNRYRNALHHADRVAGGLVEELERSGALERTILVVTGDHGEEFAENGFWGHTGNFTPEQVAVPFLLRGPGIEPGVETRPTSHTDLPATLLELLGADPGQRSDWCLAGNLLAPAEFRRRVVASWSEVGLVSELGIVRLPRSPSREDAVSVWTRGWQVAADQREAFEALAGDLERLDEECNRFLAGAQ